MLVNKLFIKAVMVLLLVLLSSCGTSPKTNFYLLNSTHDIENEVTENISIGVWQVKLPDMIDRPEIVTRTGEYTIDLADFHRWAGGLGSNINLLIANELSYKLKTTYVDISPWSTYRQLDYQVKVHIRSFDGELGGESMFEGAYIILNGKGNKKIIEENFLFKENVKGMEYNNLAEAMSQLVVDLSDKISKSISMQISGKIK